MPGEPELQKLLWDWRQMFACHTCPVCHPQEPAQGWALCGNQLGFYPMSPASGKGKTSHAFPSFISKVGTNQRWNSSTYKVCLQREGLHAPINPSCLSHRGKVWGHPFKNWLLEPVLLQHFCLPADLKQQSLLSPTKGKPTALCVSRAQLSGIIFGLFSFTKLFDKVIVQSAGTGNSFPLPPFATTMYCTGF